MAAGAAMAVAAQLEHDYPTTPGSKSLEEWGAVKIPAGANQGASFEEIFLNPQHRAQYLNRKAVSQWMLSLKGYLTAKGDQKKDLETKTETEPDGEFIVIEDPPKSKPDRELLQGQINLTVPAGSVVAITVTKPK